MRVLPRVSLALTPGYFIEIIVGLNRTYFVKAMLAPLN